LHGYALSFKFVFECEVLNSQNWCIDFGGLKALKATLEENFDHKLLVAKDDPAVDEICMLAGIHVADVRVVDRVGCEAFAHMGFTLAEQWLYDNGHAPRVWLKSCEVAEHAGNSAVYLGED
jgi:6-pyruvoyltetrahydropterin/6-carboxytetrahydropterin synthase